MKQIRDYWLEIDEIDGHKVAYLCREVRILVRDHIEYLKLVGKMIFTIFYILKPFPYKDNALFDSTTMDFPHHIPIK